MSQSLPVIRPHTSGGELSTSKSIAELPGGRKTTALQRGFNLRVAQFTDRQLSHSSIEARKAFSVLQRQMVTDGQAADDMTFCGNSGVQGFRTLLKRKYGSVVAGWRRIDQDKNGRLSFYEFCNACRAMGYTGNLKKLWKELDENGNGFISLMQLDPEVGRIVGTFKLLLLKKYGDMLTAWKKGLDVNGNGRIEEAEVEKCLATLCKSAPADHEIHRVTGKKLFNMLKGPSLGMTLIDFDPDAHQRLITGDFKGLVSRSHNEFIEDLPDIGQDSVELLERSKRGGAQAFRRELAIADSQEVSEAQRDINQLRLGLHTVGGFKVALVNRCGSLLSAWRQSLDLDGNARLTFGEFTQALYKLGFHGDVKGLWRQLDVKGMGYIVFGDLDKDTDDALTELRVKLCKKYGNMLLAWMKGLDIKGTNVVEEKTFVSCCESIGFSGDARQLFLKMRPEAGRSFLTLKDFDTKAYNALHRGDFRMLSESEFDMRENQKRPLDMTFHERQEAGFFYQVRRAWDAAKQAEFAKACRLANEPDHEMGSNEAFQSLLSRKYGSIISAWRNCLDPDHNGKLTFNEFCQAVRWLGYTGSLKTLWTLYDRDGKGYVLLKDLDPEADDHVSSLLALLTERFGDLDSAWKYGFNKDPHDSIDEAELKKACDELGYQRDVHKLMKCLQPLPGRQLITIWDLDPVCSKRRAQGKDSFGSSQKSPSSKTAPRPEFAESSMLDEEGRALNISVGDEGVYPSTSSFDNRVDGSKAAHDLRMLCLALRNKYGSTVAAWRASLDPEHAGSVSFGKFVIVLNDCSFHGNVKTLWAELAGTRGSISFSDLDPDSASILDECRNFFLTDYGTVLKAWHGVLDRHGVGKVDKEDFLNKMMGKVKSPGKLFKLLLARHGQRSLNREDMECLLIPLPSWKRGVVWSGYTEDFHQSPEFDGEVPGYTWKKGRKGAGYYKEDAEPDSPTANSPAAGSPKMSDTTLDAANVSARHHIDKMSLNHHGKDKGCTDLASFKKILTIKYGSLFAAWRKGLDDDGNGVVTQLNFAKSCQKMGVKAIQKLWSEFDKNKDGQISLNELDPDCATLFNFLERLLIEHYGNTKRGWQEVFDPKKSLRCDVNAFCRGCQFLNFDCDAVKLFRLLRPEPGRSYLGYDDLWIDVNIKAGPHDFTQGSPWSVRKPKKAVNSPTHSPRRTSPLSMTQLPLV